MAGVGVMLLFLSLKIQRSHGLLGDFAFWMSSDVSLSINGVSFCTGGVGLGLCSADSVVHSGWS